MDKVKDPAVLQSTRLDVSVGFQSTLESQRSRSQCWYTEATVAGQMDLTMTAKTSRQKKK